MRRCTGSTVRLQRGNVAAPDISCIETDERLSERKAGKNSNNREMFKKRWEDFAFAEADGEPIGDVQKRNIEALNEILQKICG